MTKSTSAKTETPPQDRPTTSTTEQKDGADNSDGNDPKMQHDLEVAQAILNVRQESKPDNHRSPSSGPPPGLSGPPGMHYGMSPGEEDDSPSKQGMPPMDGSQPSGMKPGMPPHMSGPYNMPPPHMMEYGGPIPPYYMGENGGPFYPPFHPQDAEQYHHMMASGAMGEMPGYYMDPNMMGGPGPHFYHPMMHPDAPFPMMAGYPPGVYMHHKRPHPDDSYQGGGDTKRSKGMQQQGKEDAKSKNNPLIEKHKKGKRAADMPRRPLSAYNFFFSEERERILAAIPDTDEKSNEKATKTDTEEKSDKDEKEEKNTEKTENKEEKKLTKEEMDEKIEARSKHLLSLREASNIKRRPHRKSHGKIGFKELVKKIGERWRSLSAEDKVYYNGLAKKDLERYKEQIAEYNSKNDRGA